MTKLKPDGITLKGSRIIYKTFASGKRYKNFGILELIENNLELLYQWTDDGTVLNAETDPGDNWVGNIYNEIWGFVQNDHEFAVMGSTEGTHIFDVTDPANGYLVASIDGASTSSEIVHRDFHTYAGYLYAVADEMNTSTLQIIDMETLKKFSYH